jgi:hypothetical protein
MKIILKNALLIGLVFLVAGCAGPKTPKILSIEEARYAYQNCVQPYQTTFDSLKWDNVPKSQIQTNLKTMASVLNVVQQGLVNTNWPKSVEGDIKGMNTAIGDLIGDMNSYNGSDEWYQGFAKSVAAVKLADSYVRKNLR